MDTWCRFKLVSCVKEFIMGIEFSGTGRNGSVFFIKIDFHFRVEYSARMFESLHVLL